MNLLTAKTILYDRVQTLLKASGAFYTAHPTDADGMAGDVVRPGNLILLRGKVTVPPKLTSERQDPAAFPEAILFYGPWQYHTEPPDARGRYGMSSGAKVSGRTKELAQMFHLLLTYRGTSADTNDPLDAAVIDALDDGGEQMGLVPAPFPYCVRGPVDAEPDFGFTERSGETFRAQTLFSFIVEVRWHGEPAPTQQVA